MPQTLRRVLRSWQIFMIAISGTVGAGIFVNSGEILRIAGPGGALIAFGIAGLAAICSMDGHAEMVGLWPVANAKVRYVKAFVDKDLGTVVGIAYWYTFAMIFANNITITIFLVQFWNPSTAVQVILLIVAPISLLCINLCGVRIFGIIELIGGTLKLLLITGAILLLICINCGAGPFRPIGSQHLSDGLQVDLRVAENAFAAVCVCIPIASFAFVGVEIISAAAVEARNPRELRIPANSIALAISGMYMLLVLMYAFDVSWEDPELPQFYGLSNSSSQNSPLRRNSDDTATTSYPNGLSVLVIAVLNARVKVLADFIVGALIFSALSAANTALYVASRTLFGITKDINQNSKDWMISGLAWLGRTNDVHVPCRALFVSTFAFGGWIPALLFARPPPGVVDLQQILSEVAAVSCMFVWASQCLAFIRYRRWLNKLQPRLKDDYKKYNVALRDNESIIYGTFLSLRGFQPAAAGLGLILCFLIIFVFNTASWWKRPVALKTGFATFSAPVALFLFWIALKIWNRRWSGFPYGFAHLDDDWNKATAIINRFEENIEDCAQPRHTHPSRLGRDGIELSDVGGPYPANGIEDRSGDITPTPAPTRIRDSGFSFTTNIRIRDTNLLDASIHIGSRGQIS